MEILFICPFCEQEMTVDEAGIGEEIPCPNCAEQVIIQRCERKPAAEAAVDSKPDPRPDEVKPAPAAEAKPEPAPQAKPVEAAAKDEAATARAAAIKAATDAMIKKPHGMLGGAEETGGEGSNIFVKTIRRNTCTEMERDNFDKFVSKFLAGIQSEDIIGLHPTAYSYVNSQGVNIHDYGIMIIYRGAHKAHHE